MKVSCLLLLLLAVPAHALEPFGSDAKVPAKTIKPATPAAPLALSIFSPESAATWTVEPETTGLDGLAKFAVVDGKNALQISTAKFVPLSTTLRTPLPESQNGALWSKNRANYVSFWCKSDAPAEMSFHLLQKGKSPGTFKMGFTAKPGDWRRVILPLPSFGLKSFAPVLAVAFRTSAPSNATVSLADIAVGGMPYSDDAWKTHRLSIPMSGEWKFSPDSEDKGCSAKWFDANFDDSAWKTLKTGLGWQEQGVEASGWGWYRQKVFIPKGWEGTPVLLSLGDIPSDDEAWFNGARVGGWSGNYLYATQEKRVYTVAPESVRYGENNTIAVRVWGGDLGFTGPKSGFKMGVFQADLDPYRATFREPGGPETAAELFDLSDAQHQKPFEIVFHLPGDIVKDGANLNYDLTDYSGHEITGGRVPMTVGPDGIARAAAKVDGETAQTIYLRGRFKSSVVLFDAKNEPIYNGQQEFNRLNFGRRDDLVLPALPETFENTPCGKLRLVDEIDASEDTATSPHPYLQSGYDPAQKKEMPGSPLNVTVHDILGKKARESDFGWFAYRIGRGGLKPHSTYLVRIEYPEDKPRYCPIEFQAGNNYMDIGWKSGLGPENAEQPWPLTQKWAWYDTILPLDDETTGTGGTASASAKNGFWIYFLNKSRPDSYYAPYSAGPAVARIKLYEIDPEKNAPAIIKPQNLPSRVLMLDWERQDDNDPGDIAKYVKLMGYNTVAGLILKWGTSNFGDPLKGYDSSNYDARGYWVRNRYDPKTKPDAGEAVPGKPTVHARYLAATKKWGLNYIVRFEYGGSMDLPVEARATGADGLPAKPNRFAQWGADLLHPATFDDLKKAMDSLIKPYAKDNPQLLGALWRIRSDRMPISYSRADIELFAKETNTPLPAGGYEQMAAWAAGEMKGQYDSWWLQKRADFHKKLVDLLDSYRGDLKLWYYNWDEDKFALIEPDLNSWGFIKTAVVPGPTGGRAAYDRANSARLAFTAADYIAVMKSGNFGKPSNGINRADYAVRPELYNFKNFELFAPANTFAYANKADYLNYFRTPEGLAVSNIVSYDENAARYVNPKYEGNFMTPGGAPYSMAIELLSWFHGDARTLTWTSYEFGRGFADAHRRFAQAFLALPAIDGKEMDSGDADIKIRTYASANGTYIGVGNKAFGEKKVTVKIAGKSLQNLVTGETVSLQNGQFEVSLSPMELDAFLVK